MPVAATLRAATDAELDRLPTHDAPFDPDLVVFEPERGSVEIPFSQRTDVIAGANHTVEVDDLEVEVQVTDETAFHNRLRIGNWGGWESERRWSHGDGP